MSTNEGQPSGLNPEWEINREQNIAIARRIDDLLLHFPDTISEVDNIGYVKFAEHVYNRSRAIHLGVGISEEASRDEMGSADL